MSSNENDSDMSSPREIFRNQSFENGEYLDFEYEPSDNMSNVDFTSDFMKGPGRTELIKALAVGWSKEFVKRAEAKLGVKTIKEKIKGEPFLRAKDKVSFLIGVLGILFTEYITISYPTYLYLVYTIIFVPLIGWRFLSYHRSKYHYFMLDFCYYSNLLTMLWLYIWPNNLKLFKLTFALATGPLLMAVIAWSNSLVFHDLDRTTSLFIHYYPPLVLYNERWHNPSLFTNYPAEEVSWAGIMEAIVVPLIFYALWQVAYLIKTEVLDRKKFAADADMVTSARWLTTMKPHALYLQLRKMGIGLPPVLLLVLFQLCYTTLMLIPTILFYHYRWANILILLLVLTFACWNGAYFYFDIFSEKYRQRLQSKVADDENQASSSWLPTSLKSVLTFTVWFGALIFVVRCLMFIFC